MREPAGSREHWAIGLRGRHRVSDARPAVWCVGQRVGMGLQSTRLGLNLGFVAS